MSTKYFTAILVSFVLTTGMAQAFSLSPPIVDMQVETGKPVQGTLRIANTTDRVRTYHVSAENFVARGEEGQQDFISDANHTGLASWIIPQDASVTLEPNEVRDFSYTIAVPSNAPPGGHYAALFFSNVAEGTQEESRVGVGAKTGALFLIRVSGTIREDARLESFRVGSPTRTNRLPVSFELRVRNLGNVHLRPEGNIVVTNMLGRVSARVPLNPEGRAVLPNSVRRIETTWTRSSGTDPEGFGAEIVNEWKNFAFGKYTAELDATYGATKSPLEGRVTFWIFPWRITLIVIIAAIAFFFASRMYRRMVVRDLTKPRKRKSS